MKTESEYFTSMFRAKVLLRKCKNANTEGNWRINYNQKQTKTFVRL